MKPKRLISLTMFDLLKGMAMLAVVMRHSIGWSVEETLIWKILYSVLMPVFFVTSGYWLKKKDIKSGFKTSCEFLLKPFILVILVINIIGAVHRGVLHNMQEWVDLFLIPSLLVKSGVYTRIGPMWFVFALFLSWCLFYLIVNLRNEKLQIVLACISCIIGGILMKYELPFQISQGLVGFFFLYSGYYLKKKKLLDTKIHPGIYLLMVVCWGFSVLFGSMDLSTYHMKYGVVSAIGSLCGSFLVIKIFLHLNLVENKVFDWIKWIGRYTMWILCIHSVEAAVVPWKILFKYVEQNTAAGCLAQFLLRSLLIGVTCWGMIKIQKYHIKKRRI